MAFAAFLTLAVLQVVAILVCALPLVSIVAVRRMRRTLSQRIKADITEPHHWTDRA